MSGTVTRLRPNSGVADERAYDVALARGLLDDQTSNAAGGADDQHGSSWCAHAGVIARRSSIAR